MRLFSNFQGGIYHSEGGRGKRQWKYRESRWKYVSDCVLKAGWGENECSLRLESLLIRSALIIRNFFLFDYILRGNNNKIFLTNLTSNKYHIWWEKLFRLKNSDKNMNHFPWQSQWSSQYIFLIWCRLRGNPAWHNPVPKIQFLGKIIFNK